MAPSIPLIDLYDWRCGSGARRRALAPDVDLALRTSGFMMVAGHGVSEDIAAEIREATGRFFALPDRIKHRYATTVGGRGWIPAGAEANDFYGEIPDPELADLKETYTSGRDFLSGEAAIDAEWFAPNVWPTEVPELSHACRRYAEAVRTVYYELLDLCSVVLDMPEGWLTQQALSSPHTFNINRYPPLSETGPPKPGQFRIAAHTDWGILTILDRQPGYGGLQVQDEDGTWVDAPDVDGAFTVNVGDLLSRWTGGRWRSSRHRVLPPPAGDPEEELISLIMFMEVDATTIIDPLPTPYGGGTHCPPIPSSDYLRERATAATVA